MFGCACCDKWKAFDDLFDEIDPLSLLEGIGKLEEELRWRKEMLQEFQQESTATPILMENKSIVLSGDEIQTDPSKNQDSAPS